MKKIIFVGLLLVAGCSANKSNISIDYDLFSKLYTVEYKVVNRPVIKQTPIVFPDLTNMTMAEKQRLWQECRRTN